MQNLLSSYSAFDFLYLIQFTWVLIWCIFAFYKNKLWKSSSNWLGEAFKSKYNLNIKWLYIVMKASYVNLNWTDTGEDENKIEGNMIIAQNESHRNLWHFNQDKDHCWHLESHPGRHVRAAPLPLLGGKVDSSPSLVTYETWQKDSSSAPDIAFTHQTHLCPDTVLAPKAWRVEHSRINSTIMGSFPMEQTYW